MIRIYVISQYVLLLTYITSLLCDNSKQPPVFDKIHSKIN